jgi:hypothetical protein
LLGNDPGYARSWHLPDLFTQGFATEFDSLLIGLAAHKKLKSCYFTKPDKPNALAVFENALQVVPSNADIRDFPGLRLD